MKFKKVSDTHAIIDHITDTVTSHLSRGERVLWLIPGGSAIAIASEVGKRLVGLDMKGLYVTLTDERFGDVGHADSNWQQLSEAGFRLSGAKLSPVLHNLDIKQTTRLFAKELETQLANVDFSIGLFGMGADGHTAGILPNSTAVSSTQLAAHYPASQYLRITMTPKAIAQLDEAVLYAAGQEKWDALERLQEKIALSLQPAQILKQVPMFTIYNDYKGEEV